MKTLCTFSGKFGDIMWSLPTVREVSYQRGQAVDLAIMPQYKSLLPLLSLQPYIEKAFVIPEWITTGSPYGDQPWEAPAQKDYDETLHLTYRQHPGVGCPAIPLVEFIAWQQGMTLRRPIIPFMTNDPIDIFPPPPQPVIPYAFNGDYHTVKQQFLGRLVMRTAGLLAWVDVGVLPWTQAASIVNQAGIFVGCRSANWVIGMAVGALTITYEPNPARHASGPWGKVFSGPAGAKEEPLTLNQSPHDAADQAVNKLLAWRDQYWEREKKGEVITS